MWRENTDTKNMKTEKYEEDENINISDVRWKT